MNKKYLITAGIILVIFVIAYVLRPAAEKSSDVRIISNDGKMELVIPIDAIPADVDSKNIKISALSYDDAPFTLEDKKDFITAYTMEPDGLIFKKSITFKTEIKLGEKNILPEVAHIQKSRNIAETPKNVSFTIDQEKNTAIAQGQFSHFSTMVFFNSRGGMYLNEGRSVQVGETFTVDGNVWYTGGKWRMYFEEDDTKLLIEEKPEWSLSGEMKPNYGKVAPAFVANLPINSRMSGDSYAIPRQTFTCLEPGNVEMIYKATITRVRIQKWEGTSLSGDFNALFLDDTDGEMTTTYNVASYFGCRERYGVKKPSTTMPSAPAVTPKSSGSGMVCGLPGGPACPKK